MNKDDQSSSKKVPLQTKFNNDLKRGYLLEYLRRVMASVNPEFARGKKMLSLD